jgi:hypothetical protein
VEENVLCGVSQRPRTLMLLQASSVPLRARDRISRESTA